MHHCEILCIMSCPSSHEHGVVTTLMGRGVHPLLCLWRFIWSPTAFELQRWLFFLRKETCITVLRNATCNNEPNPLDFRECHMHNCLNLTVVSYLAFRSQCTIYALVVLNKLVNAIIIYIIIKFWWLIIMRFI